LTEGLEKNIDSLPAGRISGQDHNRLFFEFAETADAGLEGLVPDFDPKALEDEPQGPFQLSIVHIMNPMNPLSFCQTSRGNKKPE
jgi:hypothetical protein